jgi:hypothetical protein
MPARGLGKVSDTFFGSCSGRCQTLAVSIRELCQSFRCFNHEIFYLVPKLCFGTEAIEAPLQNYCKRKQSFRSYVPKWNLGTRKSCRGGSGVVWVDRGRNKDCGGKILVGAIHESPKSGHVPPNKRRVNVTCPYPVKITGRKQRAKANVPIVIPANAGIRRQRLGISQTDVSDVGNARSRSGII